MNNKGLSNSLVAITVVLFLFAFLTIMVKVVWTPFNEQIQELDDSVASDEAKAKVDDLTTYINWGDKLFTFFLVALLLAYLITSFTLPPQNAWMFLIFAAFLVLVTFLAMVLSNSWSYMLSDPVFIDYAGDVPLTDYVLRHFPVFIFFVGIVGGVIFYSRSREDGGSSGGFVDQPTNMGGEF